MTGIESSPPLGRRARLALGGLGIALIAAGLLFAFGFVVNILAGLVEPVHPSGLEQTLFAAYALFAILLLATGIVSLRCRSRRGLRALGMLAAAAAATLSVSLVLYRQAMQIACRDFLAEQATMPDVSIEDGFCLER